MIIRNDFNFQLDFFLYPRDPFFLKNELYNKENIIKNYIYTCRSTKKSDGHAWNWHTRIQVGKVADVVQLEVKKNYNSALFSKCRNSLYKISTYKLETLILIFLLLIYTWYMIKK